MRRSLFVVVAFLSLNLAAAAPVPGQGTWESTLHARDVNNDGKVDAYYDSTQNITWLADANSGAGNSYDDAKGFNPAGGQNTLTDGAMTLTSARIYIAEFDLLGIKGWRMPSRNLQFTSELDTLFHDVLGIKYIYESGFTIDVNTGPFVGVPVLTNIYAARFWEQPDWEYSNTDAWGQSIGIGAGLIWDDEASYAWLVRDGDVALSVVPEPTSWGMTICGLAFVAWRIKSVKAVRKIV